jgi:hypothetical protein
LVEVWAASFVPEHHMLCGWRTRSMFDRYNIIDETDLAAAVAKRFGNGKQRRTSRLPRAGRIL